MDPCVRPDREADKQRPGHDHRSSDIQRLVLCGDDGADALWAYPLYGNRLIDSNRRTTEVLESISDGFFALDEQMVVTYFNKAAEELLGRKSADLLGRRLFEVFPESQKVLSLKNSMPAR